MKAVIFIIVWLFGFLLSIFFWLLICRLNGEDPEDVYEFDVEWIPIYLSCLALWPFVLAAEISYFSYKFVKKWFVLAIETIVAAKESKEEDNE